MKIFSTRNLVLFIYASALLLSRMSFANECKDLGEELEAMRKAQYQIMTSLVSNHQDFAETMNSLVDEVATNSNKISRSNLMSLKRAAQSYRARGEKGQSIAEKLDLASAHLIAKTKKCLR